MKRYLTKEELDAIIKEDTLNEVMVEVEFQPILEGIGKLGDEDIQEFYINLDKPNSFTRFEINQKVVEQINDTRWDLDELVGARFKVVKVDGKKVDQFSTQQMYLTRCIEIALSTSYKATTNLNNNVWNDGGDYVSEYAYFLQHRNIDLNLIKEELEDKLQETIEEILIEEEDMIDLLDGEEITNYEVNIESMELSIIRN